MVLSKENDNYNGADILNLNVSIKNAKFICKVYDKRDKFYFSVVRLTPRFINQLNNIGYCTFDSQFIRFTRIRQNMLSYRWCKGSFTYYVFTKGEATKCNKS